MLCREGEGANTAFWLNVIIGLQAYMLNITDRQIDETLPKIKEGLYKYCWIQDNFWICNVKEDHWFQTKFNGFYKVRRNAVWRNHYYELFETAKTQPISFFQALYAIQKSTGRIEASFVSKMIATIQPNSPVIDAFVLKNFRLTLPRQGASNRESKTIQVYDELCQEYERLLSSKIAQEICNKFSKAYPWAPVSNIKKLDLFLWQTR